MGKNTLYIAYLKAQTQQESDESDSSKCSISRYPDFSVISGTK
jgi:hypothetical protein